MLPFEFCLPFCCIFIKKIQHQTFMNLRRRYGILTAGIFLIFSAITSFAQEKKPVIAATPVWVQRTQQDYSNTSLDNEAEDGYIDINFERQISLVEGSTYFKRSMRILSEGGVQNMSQVSVSYDPSYEQLIFHTIDVIRDKKRTSQLQLAKMKVLHEEEELDRFIYNGELKAVRILDDIQPGDIIEYSYTIKGRNPVFNNKFSGMMNTRFGVPFYYWYARLIVPAGREITLLDAGNTIKPEISRQAKQTVYEWKDVNLSAVRSEDKLPSWYDPYPAVILSEYKSWNEVSRWAATLFPQNITLSGELQQKINEIKSADTTPEKRVLAALHFVQDKIRYMGFEMGTGSHRPAHPDKVFAQRFGDCKEKSYLLNQMLKAMGIESELVLISTNYKATLNKWLPAASAFDHVTIRVKLNNRYYWFDPTISCQRGNIDAIEFPDYQCGLVVSDTTTSLTHIPFHAAGMVKVHELFVVPADKGEVTLKVTTTYTGSFADDIRSEFMNNSTHELQQQYKKFYQHYYEQLKIDSINHHDDETTGTFVVNEYYRAGNFWNSKSGKKAILQPFVINQELRGSNEKTRTMPFDLNFPVKMEEVIQVDMKGGMAGDPVSEHIQCGEFVFDEEGATTNDMLTLTYTYENLKDYVTPEHAENYFTLIDQVDDSKGYTISKNKEQDTAVTQPGTTSNATTIIVSIVLLLALVVGMLWWSQRD